MSSQLEQFFTAQLGEGWQERPIVYLDGEQTIAALWPMFEVFRPHLGQINATAYSSAYEPEADEALAALASGELWTAGQPSADAWRVLYERHTQSLVVAAANQAAGNSRLVPVPQALQKAHHTIAAVLFLQWRMALPRAPVEPPSFAVPQGSLPGNLRQH